MVSLVTLKGQAKACVDQSSNCTDSAVRKSRVRASWVIPVAPRQGEKGPALGANQALLHSHVKTGNMESKKRFYFVITGASLLN